jgi:hypothetical protein
MRKEKIQFTLGAEAAVLGHAFALATSLDADCQAADVLMVFDQFARTLGFTTDQINDAITQRHFAIAEDALMNAHRFTDDSYNDLPF